MPLSEAQKKFEDQRSQHLSELEQNLYSQLFATTDNDQIPGSSNLNPKYYKKGEYKPSDFMEWLNSVERKKGLNILGDYNFSDREKALRKTNNPFLEEYHPNRRFNQGIRGAGHLALLGGYGESRDNNRQFPDEVEKYMSPHQKAVIDQVVKDMGYEKQQGLDNIGSEYIKAGAHRSGILKPNAENKYDRAMSATIAGEVGKLRNQGYQQAAQIFNADRLAREQNINSRIQLPFAHQRFEKGQLGTLENLNNMQAQDRQNVLNSAYGRYQEQHSRPFEDVANLHSIMSQGGYRPSHNYDNPAPQMPSFFQESKEGGRISIRDMAEQLAKKGRHGDSELAHVNPIEAAVLKSMGGSGGVNPETGLREYSFFSNPGKAIKGLGKGNRFLAEAAGLLGAGFGGVGGGALGGAVKAALLKQNLLKGALGGAALGYALPAGAGMLGKALGPNSGIGSTLSKYGASNAGNFGSIGSKFFGTSSGPNIINSTLGINPHGGPSAAAFGSHNPFKVLEAEEEGGGMMSKLMGKDKGWLDYATGLAPAAIQGIGMMDQRREAKKDRSDAARKEDMEREMLMREVAAQEAREAKNDAKESELLALNRPVEDERRKFEMAKMKHEQDRWAKKSAMEEKMMKDKEKREEEDRLEAENARNFLAGLKTRKFERPILAYGDGGRVACFKEGGRVTHNSRTLRFASGGYVDGSNSGVKDNVRADLPEGAYVLDATTISLLGDGNSKAGAKKIDEFLNNKRMEDKTSTDTLYIPSVHERKIQKQLKAGGELSKVQGRIVPAKISNGEYVLSPEDVIMFSQGGSLDEGARMLDKMRDRLKGQKGVKRHGILPPSKPIENYLRG